MPGEPIEETYRELTEIFRDRPLAYAGYRISELKKRGSGISESDEIPFVTTPVFLFAIVGYVLVARAKYRWKQVTGDPGPERLPEDGHLFSMTSTHGYRSRSFLEVAEALQERGEEVCLLCSPAAADERSSWEADGLRTTTHRELHGRIGVPALVRSVAASVVETGRLWAHGDTHRSLSGLYQYFNFILLEHVKRESVRDLTAEQPNVHTFSPMPYLVDSTTADRLFAYQHGIQMSNHDKCLSLPFFAPMHLFIWGDAWLERFGNVLHSESTLHVVGSPWYDYLASRRADREVRTDVLFVGGSHGLTDPDVAEEYEQLMRTTVETCERNGYSLGIKLHPLESTEWYDERGWGEYVASFDDIDDALLQSGVAVTNTSTAFVESAVLSVPVVVADLFEKGLSDLAPVDYIRFTDGPEVAEAVEDAVEGGEFQSADSRPLVVLDGSRDRIVDVVLGREENT